MAQLVVKNGHDMEKKRKEKITPIFNTGVNVSPLAIY